MNYCYIFQHILGGQELQPTLVSLEEGRTVFELQNLSSPFVSIYTHGV